MTLTCRRRTSVPLRFHILKSRKTRLVELVSVIKDGFLFKRCLRTTLCRVRDDMMDNERLPSDTGTGQAKFPLKGAEAHCLFNGSK